MSVTTFRWEQDGAGGDHGTATYFPGMPNEISLRASHGQAPAGAAEEIDKALNVYAQAFAARVNGWTRQNGDDLPGARSALFAAIHAYAQASTRPTTSPQADNKKKDPL